MSSRGHREVHHREPVDNESLIRLVRQRPCIYNKRDPNYKDQSKRESAWLEICQLTIEDWETMLPTDRSNKLSILKIHWKGLHDCFDRYLRKINEAMSGSGGKRVVPYVHAAELEFLRPFLDLREIQSSWEVGDEGQDASQEAASQEVGGLLSLDHPLLLEEQEEAQDSNQGEASNIQQPAEPIQLRSQRRGRPPRGSNTQNINRFAELVDRMNQKLDQLNSEDHGFGLMVAGMLQKVPQERKHKVKKAVMDLLEASIRNDPSIPSSPMF
ncbi:uncharacterized protein LOC143939950 [Lithobates pipiens]